MKRPFLSILLILTFYVAGCEEQSPVIATNEKGIEILFGIGNQIEMARETPLFNEAPVHMISSWFSKPEDLQWMRYYDETDIITELYAKGFAHELIVWLHNYPQYALSDSFQTDLREVIEIFKGDGPEYGPLYVVLFTEFETYSDDPQYYLKLKDAFLQSMETIKEVYPRAKVAMGFGGYGWSGIEERQFKEWETEVLQAGDFIAVQAHHNAENMEIMVSQIRNSIDQLGMFEKPVMLSHFRIWVNEDQPEIMREEAFRYVISEIFNEESLSELVEDGLFAWNFFWGGYINEGGKAYRSIREVVKTYGSPKTELSYYRE